MFLSPGLSPKLGLVTPSSMNGKQLKEGQWQTSSHSLQEPLLAAPQMTETLHSALAPPFLTVVRVGWAGAGGLFFSP